MVVGGASCWVVWPRSTQLTASLPVSEGPKCMASYGRYHSWVYKGRNALLNSMTCNHTNIIIISLLHEPPHHFNKVSSASCHIQTNHARFRNLQRPRARRHSCTCSSHPSNVQHHYAFAAPQRLLSTWRIEVEVPQVRRSPWLQKDRQLRGLPRHHNNLPHGQRARAQAGRGLDPLL